MHSKFVCFTFVVLFTVKAKVMTADDKTIYSKKARFGLLLAHLIEMMKATDRAMCREMENGREVDLLEKKYDILSNRFNKILAYSRNF